MACSAIYFLDNKGKVLLCRNYRGDIDNTVIDNFISKLFHEQSSKYLIMLEVTML